jgi:hypothetical protein
MPRIYRWEDFIVDTTTTQTFWQQPLVSLFAGDTLMRVNWTLELENGQTFQATQFPLDPTVYVLGITDGPWAAWQAAHPTDIAEPTYGFLHFERVYWRIQEHTLPSTGKFTSNYAPQGDPLRNTQSERKILSDGDTLFVAAQTFISHGAPEFLLHIGGRALILGPP